MEKILLVDDDADIRRVVGLRLKLAGYQVLAAEDGEAGLALLRAERPRLVLLDLMMPKMHGFAVCQAIRADEELKQTYIIVGSAKAYPADIKKALALGANAYLHKPYDFDELVKAVAQGLTEAAAPITKTEAKPAAVEVGRPRAESTAGPVAVSVKFWGTRGSIATPGPATLRYGGNTSCTEVRCGDAVLLFDCGTGIRPAGIALLEEFKGRPIEAHIFVSHTHWDHIQGFPFFLPAYAPGNRIFIYSLRAADKSLEKVFTGQMDSNYFPVDLLDMKANLRFVELEGPVIVGPAKISHFYLNHPGVAIGFRVEAGGKSVVYVTDHEPYVRLTGDNEHNRKLDREIDEFARGADIYIREAQYTEEEYPIKKGWGHSTWKDAVESAHAAGAKKLVLYHHDPMHDDEFIDRMVAACRAHIAERGMRLECLAAADQLTLEV